MAEKKHKQDKVKNLQNEVKEEAGVEVAAGEKAEVVSTKKVVYAEIDDEVTAIYDKFKNIPGKSIYIVVPHRAILSQSVVNLKILKRKAEDSGKKIYLVTNDKNTVHLAQKIGVEVYNKTNSEDKPELFSTETSDERLKITPLKASVNATEEYAPTRLTERKLSISEILSKFRNKKPLSVSKIAENEKKKVEKEKSKSKFVIVSPNRHALIGLISVSLIILLVIIYIALPGVTITLTPTASVLEKSVNITLADFEKNRAELETHPSHEIASFVVATKVSKSIVHSSTGKKFADNSNVVSGKITVFNTTPDVWPLIVKTRFQTSDGIVFRLPAAATIPAANDKGPGKLEVSVVADPVDAYGAATGARGNIGPSKFFLPGLKKDSQAKIFAESYEAIAGASTDYVPFISKEDIEAAKGRLKDELLKDAITQLNVAIKQKAELAGDKTAFTLLQGDQAIKTGEIQYQMDQNLEKKEVKEFTVSGEVDVSGVYYDNQAMLSILKDELLLKKSPEKELLKINEDSISYKIFQWDEASGTAKLTANIKGIEQFSIDPSKENGAQLLEKIKEHIAGLDIKEAKNYIQNLPEINKVQIDSWPAWSPNIPGISDNIKFKIMDALVSSNP